MTPSERDELRDLAAAVALGAATPEETARVERYAASCRSFREELDSLRAASSELALSVPQQDPPRRLKRAVMAAVREDALREGRRAEPRGSRWARPGVAWPALAGVLAAAALGLLVWNLTLRSDEPSGPQVASIALHGTRAAPGVRGRLIYVPDQGTAVVRLDRLPPPGRGRGYELWAIRAGAPASAGFLSPTAPGEGVAAADDLEGVTALAVTPEPLTNRSAPTGDMVIVAPLPRQG